MSQEQKYNVVYAGAIKDGFTDDAVKNVFVNKFKLSTDKVEQYFSGKRIVLKQSLSKTKAETLKLKLLDVGAEAFVVPSIMDIDTVKAIGINKPNSSKISTENNLSSNKVVNSNVNSAPFVHAITEVKEESIGDTKLDEKIKNAKNIILEQQLRSQISKSNTTQSYNKLIAFSVLLLAVTAMLYFYGKNII